MTTVLYFNQQNIGNFQILSIMFRLESTVVYNRSANNDVLTLSGFTKPVVFTIVVKVSFLTGHFLTVWFDWNDELYHETIMYYA